MHGFSVVQRSCGLFTQTRAEELAARLGLSLERRYSLRKFLGRRWGQELIVLAELS
jgi:hypothetical protein